MTYCTQACVKQAGLLEPAASLTRRHCCGASSRVEEIQILPPRRHRSTWRPTQLRWPLPSTAGRKPYSRRSCPTVLHRSLDRITHTGFGPGPRGVAEPSGADIPVPGGGRFLTKSFSSQAGSRAYKLYVPSQYRGQPLALIVMLHAAPVMPGQAAALPVPTPIRKGRMPLEQCSASFPIIRSISDDRQSANQLYSLDEGFEATLSPAPRTW